VLEALFDAFVQHSPISVMMRGLMEWVLQPEKLDRIFARHGKLQYQRELMFSSLVNVMSLVVCGIHPSVNAAYKATATELNVTRWAVYSKLNGVETAVSQGLLRETVSDLGAIIRQMGGAATPLLPGYAVRILDGNALAATQRRLKVLQSVAAAPLPGKSLVVLDPELRLAVDIFPCEDGHTQERKLFAQVLETVTAKQLWIADRNMCTLDFLSGIAHRQASFVIREHLNLPWTAIETLKSCGQVEGGQLWSQPIEIAHGGETVQLHRIVLRLDRPSRHGDDQIVVLTNLPPIAASPPQVMQLYRERWQVERLFLTVTQNFDGEINTLAYPKAALFSFTLALVAYNLLATLRAALASVHGLGKIEASLSDFYLVDEIQGTYRGMMIAIPSPAWLCFGDFALTDFVLLLQDLASKVRLIRFLKQPRKEKKHKSSLVKDPKHPHVSTAKLLSDR
jgi:Transposase DDE domain